jgi:hypothetical protein
LVFGLLGCVLGAALGGLAGLVVGSVLGSVLGATVAIIGQDGASGRAFMNGTVWVCALGGVVVGLARPLQEVRQQVARNKRERELEDQRHKRAMAEQERQAAMAAEAKRAGEERRRKAAEEEIQRIEQRKLSDQRARIDRRKRRRAEIEEERKRRHARLSELRSQSGRLFHDMERFVSTADKCLVRAEVEFREGAFAPFWTEVEGAARALASYEAASKGLGQTVADYERQRLTLRPGSTSSLEVKRLSVSDARSAAAHVSQLVRAAQKDFHFATIYEQRRTNQILVAGFGTLESALFSLGDRIDSSLADLSESLNVPLANLLRSTDQVRDGLDREQGRQERANQNVAERLGELDNRLQEDNLRRQDSDTRMGRELEEQTRILEELRRRDERRDLNR